MKAAAPATATPKVGIFAPIEAIAEEFSGWHALQGTENARPIDTLGDLGAIWMNRRDAEANPGPADAALRCC